MAASKQILLPLSITAKVADTPFLSNQSDKKKICPL